MPTHSARALELPSDAESTLEGLSHHSYLAEVSALRQLVSAYKPAEPRFEIEDSPFGTLFVDITHRCNMACANCYIPNRALPDFPAGAIYSYLARLPKRTRIRLVGAEPTLRPDLADLIRNIRAIGHLPVILSNGLKLASPSYVNSLKSAGLRTVHLSLNGGLRDELYLAIDELACAQRKLKALDVLSAAKMNITVGMILVRDCNEWHLDEFLGFILQRSEVRAIYLRSVGQMGRHLQGQPLSLTELKNLLFAALETQGLADELRETGSNDSSVDYQLGRTRFQLTEWPEMGSMERGRLTPDGFVEPMFESAVENDGGY